MKLGVFVSYKFINSVDAYPYSWTEDGLACREHDKLHELVFRNKHKDFYYFVDRKNMEEFLIKNNRGDLINAI